MSLARSRKHWRHISILYFLMIAHWLLHTLQARAPLEPKGALGWAFKRALAGILVFRLIRKKKWRYVKNKEIHKLVSTKKHDFCLVSRSFGDKNHSNIIRTRETD